MLTAGIAHDLNNLLSAIVAETDLAASAHSEGVSPIEEIQKIRATALRASEVLRPLLDGPSASAVELEIVDVSQLVSDTVEVLGVLISERIVVKVDLAREFLGVNGHSAQIRQVVMNLILNASEAIAEQAGVITITTSRLFVDDQTTPAAGEALSVHDWVRLEVSDTGCGITEEQKTRIFEPRFTTKSGGRGIGLALVREVVRAHGGIVRVISAAGRGSTFQILLPPARERERRQHHLKESAPSENSPPGGRAFRAGAIGLHCSV